MRTRLPVLLISLALALFGVGPSTAAPTSQRSCTLGKTCKTYLIGLKSDWLSARVVSVQRKQASTVCRQLFDQRQYEPIPGIPGCLDGRLPGTTIKAPEELVAVNVEFRWSPQASDRYTAAWDSMVLPLLRSNNYARSLDSYRIWDVGAPTSKTYWTYNFLSDGLARFTAPIYPGDYLRVRVVLHLPNGKNKLANLRLVILPGQPSVFDWTGPLELWLGK